MTGDVDTEAGRGSARLRFDSPTPRPTPEAEVEQARVTRRIAELEAELNSTRRHFEAFVGAVAQERSSWARQRDALEAEQARLAAALEEVEQRRRQEVRARAELRDEAARLRVLIRAEAGLRHLVADDLVRCRDHEARLRHELNAVTRSRLYRVSAGTRRVLRQLLPRTTLRPR